MRVRAGLAALAIGLLGAACTGDVVDGRAGADTGTAQRTPDAAAGASDAASVEPHGELVCDQDTQAAIDATIDGQLAAFAEGDYDAALGFATESFRAATTADAFGEVIESDYPALITASGHTSGVCVAQGDQAQVVVEVEGPGAEVDELVYRMAREAGEWRIMVAARVPAPVDSATPVPV